MLCLFYFLRRRSSLARTKNAAGRWEGTVQIPRRELEVIVDLAAKGDEGGCKGPLPFLDWGLKVRH